VADIDVSILDRSAQMTTYIIMYLLPVFAMLLTSFGKSTRGVVTWHLMGAFFIFVIGLRYNVGADWLNYEEQLYSNSYTSLMYAATKTDPGYAALSWTMESLGLEIYAVNIVSSAIFITGLMALASRQKDPWLALIVSVPYTIIVVGMGYTRQSVAIGFECFALIALADNRARRFFGFIIAATLFHKSALVLLFLGLVIRDGKSITKGLLLFSALLVAGFIFVYSTDVDVLRANYIDDKLSSSGATARLILATLSALGCLLLPIGRDKNQSENRAITLLSFSIIGMLAFLLIPDQDFISTTALDRFALYVLPIHIYFWGSISDMNSNVIAKIVYRTFGISLFGVVLYVWLTQSQFAIYWIPYSSFLVR